MKNCIIRPERGQHTVTPPCRHDSSQATPPEADGRPSASGPRLPRRTPCQPHRGKATPGQLPGRYWTRTALMLANSRANAVTGLPFPGSARSMASVPVLPAIHDVSGA